MRARYWRRPPTTCRRSRLGKPAVDPNYVEGSDFDEFRHQLKQDRADRYEWPFGRENFNGYL